MGIPLRLAPPRPRFRYILKTAPASGEVEGASNHDPGVQGGGASSGGGGAAADAGLLDALVSTTRFARLTHHQWENAARDLLRLPQTPGLSSSFTGDPSPGRFDRNGSVLQVTPELMLDYRAAAETLADQVSLDQAQRAALLPKDLPKEIPARTRAFLQAFGLRAYRRPLTTDEVSRYEALFALV